MQKKRLPSRDLKRAKMLYSKLYSKAFPHAGKLALERIEIADFSLSESFEEFKNRGLGLEVEVIHSIDTNKTSIGHTGKVLMNLPYQLLIEHLHVDTEVIPKASKMPKGFVDINENVNDFKGIRKYANDGKPITGKYRFPSSKYLIVQPKNKMAKLPKEIKQIHHFEGKSETFKMMYGDAVLCSDDAKVLYTPKSKIPLYFKKRIKTTRKNNTITTRKEIYLSAGSVVLIPKNCKHALLAGKNGAVYLEFSTPSLDEADVFTETEVIR